GEEPGALADQTGERVGGGDRRGGGGEVGLDPGEEHAGEAGAAAPLAGAERIGFDGVALADRRTGVIAAVEVEGAGPPLNHDRTVLATSEDDGVVGDPVPPAPDD